jgi:glutamyl-Q tRNA(Asp) synthetase
VFRFAPSPNGLLHLGHAYSALLNRRLATDTGGRLLLRIEDIDRERCSPKLETQMLEDLVWIGFRFDGTPRRQSEHLARYRAALDRLEDMGLVYPSTTSRGEIRTLARRIAATGTPVPLDPEGMPIYPGRERELSPAARRDLKSGSADYALRLDVATALRRIGRPLAWREFEDESLNASREVAADPAAWGDVVLGRKSLATSYHLACVLDDADQGVSHVVRGLDLYAATSVHRLLQELLGLPAPSYFHHRLILDEDGTKLSKSRKSTALAHLRVAGTTVEDIRRRIGID